MSHEEIIGQLFYQDNRCGCDECLISSRKAMMKMALSISFLMKRVLIIGPYGHQMIESLPV